MRTVIQRVNGASVSVDGKLVSGFDSKGIMALVGVTEDDTEQDAEFIAKKIAQLRIMDDEQSLTDLNLPVMVISQFTLYANAYKGRRPSWIRAAKSEVAQPLVEKVAQILRNTYKLQVHEGIFGADMQVSITNDGPVTIFLDTHNKI